VDIILDLKLLALLTVANGTPVIAYNILRHRFSYPVDAGLTLPDGQRFFGPSKTYRGILLSLPVTMLAAWAIGLEWQTGLLIAAMAMIGDLFSSFLKRRLKLPASSMAIGIDQLPESLFPLLACTGIFAFSAVDVAAITVCFFAGELLISRLLYKIHLRERPY